MSTTVQVTVAHQGAHEPNGETFPEDFKKGLTDALRDAGLKQTTGGDEPKITGYSRTSGDATVYDVEVATEPRADAKGKADDKTKGDA